VKTRGTGIRKALPCWRKSTGSIRAGWKGPGLQESGVAVSGENGAEDGRFFKKGRVF
jgi:hypothetical protein